MGKRKEVKIINCVRRCLNTALENLITNEGLLAINMRGCERNNKAVSMPAVFARYVYIIVYYIYHYKASDLTDSWHWCGSVSEIRRLLCRSDGMDEINDRALDGMLFFYGQMAL